ncbi:Thioredoxin/glutathione peroxidase BtuE [Streptomyces violaceorubidus]
MTTSANTRNDDSLPLDVEIGALQGGTADLSQYAGRVVLVVNVAPLYDRLTGFADAEGHSGDIRWNFEKFLIGRDGRVAARFSPQTEPEAAEVVAAVEERLAG